MTEATPHLRRRSLLNVSVASSPLRRSHVSAVTSAGLFEPADDEQERVNRRSIVEIQRRLTNITSSSAGSPLIDTNPILDENQIKDHLRICAKLYTENRISAKNAWQLHVIDVMRKIVSTDSANILQVAGSSLDIGAKVYGLRVDDVHAKGLQLASSMAKSNEKQMNHEEDNAEVDSSMNVQKKRKEVRKKSKKLAADKRNTIDKDKKNLFAPVKKIESVVFATKENIDVSATDNLFTQKLPVNPADHQFMLLNHAKSWLRDSDEILDHADKIIEIELPQITHYNLCTPFKEFETGTWDPEEEERLLAEATNLPDVVLDDDGLPIPELDGSIHDIFEDNHDVAEDADSDAEEQEVFQAQIHGEIAHIMDAVPEESRFETEYGYNTLIRTVSGKYIDKIWAGPSHWKVKFNRRSAARYSGSTVQQVVKHTKKNKVPQLIDFSQSVDDWDTSEKFVIKRAPRTTTFEKITLPVPELSFQNFQNTISELLIKPGIPRPKLNSADINQQRDYEVQVYNYENPNDSLYCSQNNNNDGDGDNDNEPIQHSFEDDAVPAVPQHQFSDENLVNAPEIVSSTHIPYAMQAKKVDMKKLKGAIWTCLTENSGDKDKDLKNFRSMQFSALYSKLPQLLSQDMRKELTRPLTVVALLHLCNENNLILSQDNSKDFIINKAEK